MKWVLADTAYFLALLNEKDECHHRAREASAESALRIVTTVWILSEVVDACSRPPLRRLVVPFVRALQADPVVSVVPATRRLFEAGLELFLRRPDKYWSLTDCTSFVLMKQRGIRQALTVDHHFEQAGFVALLK